MKRINIFFIYTYTFFIVFLVSCSVQNENNLDIWLKPQIRLITVNEVSILPFESSLNISPELLEVFNKKLRDELGLRTSVLVKECDIEVSKSKTLIEKAQELSNRCGTQGAIYGIITKLDNNTASFTLWLYSQKNNSVIWKAVYQDSQQAFTDNILATTRQGLGRGIKYKSSEILLLNGIKETIKSLEKSRLN